VRNVARDLAAGVEVVGVPTVRGTDGLALSSRNRTSRRARASEASCAGAGRRAHAAGRRDAALLLDGSHAAAMDPDYLELRRRDDLGAYEPNRPAILLVAAASAHAPDRQPVTGGRMTTPPGPRSRPPAGAAEDRAGRRDGRPLVMVTAYDYRPGASPSAPAWTSCSSATRAR
jgi:pantoate--beta-alanine ligase